MLCSYVRVLMPFLMIDCSRFTAGVRPFDWDFGCHSGLELVYSNLK